MWQRFTERARRVVFFAQEEAGQLGENYVSTEHLLLGMVREHGNMSVAAQILKGMGAEPEVVRAEVLKRVTTGDGRLGNDMQLTPRVKKVIDLAYEEAKSLDNNYIGTEHLLLGLLREGEGLAGRVLNDMGIQLEAARAVVRDLQDAKGEEKPTEAKSLNIDSIKDTVQRLREALLPAQTTPTAPTEESGGSLLPTRGDIGVLRAVPGRAQIEFIAAEADIVEFDDVMRTRDEYAYRDMVTTGRIVLLEAGTAIKFLRSGQYGCWYIRLLDGPRAGEVGYVRRDTLQDMRPDDRPFPPVT